MVAPPPPTARPTPRCTAVYTFLSKQAGYDPANPKAANNSLSTYATNPLWQVVDGPWKLTHFDASGNVTMTVNTSYSGPIKPTIKTFKEVPYTSDSAEFNALVAGKVDVGYLPEADVTAPTTEPAGRRSEQPAAVRLVLARPAVQLVDQLLPVQLQLDG